MGWLTQDIAGNSLVWLLITTFFAVLSGFISSWFTYRFVKRREMLDTLELKGQSEKQERIRQEVIRWANPILAAVEELESRLKNILDSVGYLALSKKYKSRVNPNWSISYDYFMNSTLFLFGQYFAWTWMLQDELSFELFESQKEKDEFFMAIRQVSKSLSSFPPKFHCSGKDAQVFYLQQRAIGELFMKGDDKNRKCISYPEFLERLTDNRFNQHLEPLQALLEDVSPKSDCKWMRLVTARQALLDLDAQCRKLLVLSEDA